MSQNDNKKEKLLSWIYCLNDNILHPAPSDIKQHFQYEFLKLLIASSIKEPVKIKFDTHRLSTFNTMIQTIPKCKFKCML